MVLGNREQGIKKRGQENKYVLIRVKIAIN